MAEIEILHNPSNHRLIQIFLDTKVHETNLTLLYDSMYFHNVLKGNIPECTETYILNYVTTTR